MLCGELLNGGFVSTGAVPVVPYGLLGLWLPGCLRATSPRSLASPYLTLLAEILATGHSDLRDELMDLAKRSHQAPCSNGPADLDLDLHADDIDENVFLGTSHFGARTIEEKSVGMGKTKSLVPISARVWAAEGVTAVILVFSSSKGSPRIPFWSGRVERLKKEGGKREEAVVEAETEEDRRRENEERRERRPSSGMAKS
ncbi:hypothetical protein KM043_000758 [Ampulex compressa]|nr:hypothetical protein KM043_000758 [Ampulex compressa]